MTPSSTLSPSLGEDSCDPLWNDEVAAAYLGIKPTTLRAWRSRGRPLLEFVTVGRCVRYRKSTLDHWLAQRVRTSTKQPLAAEGTEAGLSSSSDAPQRSKTDPAVRS